MLVRGIFKHISTHNRAIEELYSFLTTKDLHGNGNITSFHFICVVMVNNRLEFASPHSYYQILVGSQENTTYTYWSSRCEGELFFSILQKQEPACSKSASVMFSDQGEGWTPAILNSEEEWHFLRRGRVGKGDLHSYWIGGSSDADTSAGESIFYSQYINSGSGNHNTWHHVLNIKKIKP